MQDHDNETNDLALEEPAPVRVQEAWQDEPELPPRPRRRLMTPLTASLLGVLLAALGFIGGVLVQKGQEGSTGAAGGGAFASRLAGLKTGARAGTGAAGGTGAAAFGAARANLTTGKVTFIEGRTLYVETTEGGTVKVQTTAASAVTKTVKGTVAAIKPGETVVVTGSKTASGAVQAESIRAGTSSSGTGLAGLFGGAGGTGTSSKSSSGSSAEPQLFGRGG